MPNTGTWKIEEVADTRFPYRITITDHAGATLVLRSTTTWPSRSGAYCIPEPQARPNDAYNFTARRSTIGKTLDEVPIAEMRRFGRSIGIILQRANRKRCEFTFLTLDYKGKEGQYEKILWKTQASHKKKRPSSKLVNHPGQRIHIITDTREQRPWTFPDCDSTRKALPCGDYGLLINNRVVAVIERKTPQNLLQEFSTMPAFHLHLMELTTCRHAALVVETSYEKFLNEDGAPYYEADFLKKAVAEIEALHPSLKVQWPGDRQLAQAWAEAYFRAIAANEANQPSRNILEHHGEQDNADQD